jgi:hypothetical protein
MKSLRDYIAETETWIDDPAQGDQFDIELAPDSLLETHVVDITEDGIILEADEPAMALLEQHGLLGERIGTYGAVGYGGMGQTFFEKDQEIAEHGGGIGPKAHWQSLMQEQPVEEGAMKELDIQIQDYKTMTPQQFLAAYGMKKADWAMKHGDLLQKHGLQTDWTGKSGFDFVREASRILELAGVADHRYDKADDVYHEDQSAAIVAKKEMDMDAALDLGMKEQREDVDCYEEDEVDEAKYQGREVPLGKPMKGDVKKSKVYVRGPKGNVV